MGKGKRRSASESARKALEVADLVYTVNSEDLSLVAGALSVRLVEEHPHEAMAVVSAMWFRWSRMEQPQQEAVMARLVAGLLGEFCGDGEHCAMHGREGARAVVGFLAEIVHKAIDKLPKGEQ